MKQITTEELARKLAVGQKLSIIDVREDEEVAQGKIPGAYHIPLGQLPNRLDEIDKEVHHYMVYRSGSRSGRACTFLENQGYNVTNMAGGMLAWEANIEEEIE